ncbi:MAG TPA: COP23 domain-containing protein [Candidatus Obscuribacterales bacterium]
MSPLQNEFGSNVLSFVYKSVGLVAGVATLMSSGGASALTQASALKVNTLAQLPDVVVPTDNTGNTGNTGNQQGSTTTASGTRFSCELNNGDYTVMYNPENQSGQAFPWAKPSTMGDGWTPAKRCSEIARRLESYRADGLVEMGTARQNGYDTVCVKTEQVPSCRIVFTVPKGQDPLATRDRVFENLTVAESGQATEGVLTYTSGMGGRLGNLLGLPRTGSNANRPRSAYIPLKPFLSRDDGGTATRLTKPASSTRPTSKTPNLFRR